MAREWRLPGALAKVSVRTGVPVRSILRTACGNIVVALGAATRGDGLEILSSVVNVGALTAFILIKKLGPGPGNWFLPGAVPGLGVVLLVVVLVSATPLALGIGVAWFARGLAVAAIMYRRRTADETAE